MSVSAAQVKDLRERTGAGMMDCKRALAEVGGDMEDHAWFAGYVPTKAPRLAFVVVLEHAGSGGRTAGPVARQLVQAIRSTGLIGETAAVSVNRRHDR